MDSSKISEQARRLDLDLEGLAVDQIGGWLDLLRTWNKKLDLTAAKKEPELLDVMLSDAFVLAKHLPQGARVVDVGSGAGAPGLPLGIVRRDLKVTLVEPLIKRVSFLRTTLSAIGRTDIEVKRARVEDLEPHGFDVAISRATFSPEDWLAIGTKLVGITGDVWVLLAKDDAPDTSSIEPKISLVDAFEYVLPNSGHPRRAVRYAKA